MQEPMRLTSTGEWYVKYHSCDHALTAHRDKPPAYWVDEWECACNDECPVCGVENEPFAWEKVSNETPNI